MKIDRRQFLGTVGTLTGGFVVGVRDKTPILDAAPSTAPSADTVPLALKINGQRHSFAVDARISLLDLLREELHLTGTKGCDHGQCGACTVLSNGRRINSLAAKAGDLCSIRRCGVALGEAHTGN